MRFFSLLLMGCALALPLRAQTPGDTLAGPVQTITLEQALQLGLRQNLTLRRAENTVAQQRTGLSSQKNAFLPTLAFSAGTGQSYGRSLVENRVVDQTNESLDFGASARVNLFNGFADVAGVEQARAALRASRLLRDRDEQSVVFDVATGYLTVLARQEQVRVLDTTLADQRAQLRRVLDLIAAGSRPESDRYQQQAQVAQAELNLLNAQRDAQVADAQLIQILQLDPFGRYDFVIPELPSLDDDDLEAKRYDLDRLLREALDKRPDVRAQQASIRAAEQGERVARARRLPQFDVSARYGTAWTSAFQVPTPNGIRTVSLMDQFDQRRGGSVSFSLSFPLFDAFSARSAIQRAQLQTASEQLSLQDLRQGVATQVRQAYLDYLSYQKQVEVAGVQVESARQALSAAQQRYEAGAGTLLEVTQAQTALTEAQSSLVQAQYSFFFQEQLIQYYLGVLDPNAISFN